MASTLFPAEFPAIEILVKDDDWIGLEDPAERRKRQNRLHQRAWRRRKALEKSGSENTPKQSIPRHKHTSPVQIGGPQIPPAEFTDIVVESLRRLADDHVSGRHRIPTRFEVPQSRDALWTTLETLGKPQGLIAYWGDLQEQRRRELIFAVLAANPEVSNELYALSNHSRAKQSQTLLIPPIDALDMYLAGHIMPAFQFPMSADSHLFSMVQYNVLRGGITNMQIILHLNNLPSMGAADIETEWMLSLPESAPRALAPTALQQNVVHEAWIDVLPSATLRDNIIKLQDAVDVDDLCEDLVGGYEGSGKGSVDRGLVLWGEPWVAGDWEISQEFVNKWPSLLQGCEELIKSTNRWRKLRGEERLIVEL